MPWVHINLPSSVGGREERRNEGRKGSFSLKSFVSTQAAFSHAILSVCLPVLLLHKLVPPNGPLSSLARDVGRGISMHTNQGEPQPQGGWEIVSKFLQTDCKRGNNGCLWIAKK